MFTNQQDARRFFIERIMAQAVAEGCPLTDVERRMLSFSESDPESAIERLDGAHVDAANGAYEKRIAGLLRRSYRAARKTQDSSAALYPAAYESLAEGDHYLLVMVEQALGPRAAGPVGVVAKAGLFVLLVIPGAVASFMGVALAWGMTDGRAGDARQVWFLGTGALVFIAFGVYLIRIWLREARR